MEDYLEHHGILGMKWGVRRYQNPDGSLTTEGKQHVAKRYEKLAKKAQKYANERRYDSYINAVNNSVDYYNSNVLPEMNKKFEGRYGSKEHIDYANKREEELDERTDLLMNYYIAKDFVNSKYYREAKELVNQYGAENISDLAVANEKLIKDTIKNYEKKIVGERIERAKKTGKMDIDFVEFIQNDDRLMNAKNDDPKLLSAYEEWLRGKTEGYW